jgi:RNA polymerase sigma-70 factor (ECF subfamily)
MKHYQANQWAHDHALKRGGAAGPESLDAVDAEHRYLHEPSHDLTPERLYEHGWAVLLLERVTELLRAETAKLGNAELFERLRGFLVADGPDESYAALAAELDTNANALKTRISRLRKRFRELRRALSADTVEKPEDVDDELRHLAECLSLGR